MAGYRCPHCQTKFIPPGVPPDGKLNCPSCKQVLHIPKPGEAPKDPMVGKRFGGWELVRKLGEGTTAVVYEARHPERAGARAAVKLLHRSVAQDGEFLARHRREVELASKLDHPHLVRVHAHGEEHGSHFLVMDFVDGPTLEHRLDRQGALPWQDACRLVGQVADALGSAWAAHGVVHRDLKPANILVGSDGNARLADLGFAKQVGDDAPAEGLTMTGAALGSPCYMPPEQVTDARNVGPTADVYGLAATLFHGVTGKVPFDGRNAHHIMEKVLQDPAPSARSLAPTVPPAIDALIAWCLAKDPRQRPADVAAFSAALATAIANPEHPDALQALRPVAKRPFPWLWVGIGAAVILAAIGALLALR